MPSTPGIRKGKGLEDLKILRKKFKGFGTTCSRQFEFN